MANINNMADRILPGFIDEYGPIVNGGGIIIISGDYDISSTIVEIPFVDGRVGLFSRNGDFLGLK